METKENLEAKANTGCMIYLMTLGLAGMTSYIFPGKPMVIVLLTLLSFGILWRVSIVAIPLIMTFKRWLILFLIFAAVNLGLFAVAYWRYIVDNDSFYSTPEVVSKYGSYRSKLLTAEIVVGQADSITVATNLQLIQQFRKKTDHDSLLVEALFAGDKILLGDTLIVAGHLPFPPGIGSYLVSFYDLAGTRLGEIIVVRPEKAENIRVTFDKWESHLLEKADAIKDGIVKLKGEQSAPLSLFNFSILFFEGNIQPLSTVVSLLKYCLYAFNVAFVFFTGRLQK